MEKLNIGVIGCGNISDIYLKNMQHFPWLSVVACADLMSGRAQEKATRYGIAQVMTTEEMLADSSIQLIVNLTLPQSHGSLALQAVEAGKHLYNEKPLALTREEGRLILNQAKKRGVMVGCAPDTVLGAGIQTARQLIDEGRIGIPLAASASMQCHGHEHWHPSPAFYYEEGGGPLFDMGPYYLSALVTLLGPMKSVMAMTKRSFKNRTITSEPLKGTVIPVETPTHLSGVIAFAQGTLCSMTMSFDVWKSSMPHLEIHGTQGSLLIGDPNTFDASVHYYSSASSHWEEVPLLSSYTENSRGLGVADMATALLKGKQHRCNGEIAFHVLDAMHAFLESAATTSAIHLESRCEQPEGLCTFLR